MWGKSEEEPIIRRAKGPPEQIVVRYPNGAMLHGVQHGSCLADAMQEEKQTAPEPFDEVEHVLNMHFFMFTGVIVFQFVIEAFAGSIAWQTQGLSHPEMFFEALFDIVYFGFAFQLTRTWKLSDANRFSVVAMIGIFTIPCIELSYDRFNLLLFAIRVLVLGLTTFIRQMLEATMLMPGEEV